MSKILSWSKNKPVEGTIYPISREGHSLTFVEDLGVLMFGGVGASLLAEFYVYDIENNQWELFKTKGRQISPRCYHVKFYQGKFFPLYFRRTIFVHIRGARRKRQKFGRLLCNGC